MSLVEKFKFNSWNIGFIEVKKDEILETDSSRKISWMNHPYKDRFFADPFLLTKTEKFWIVLAEECKFIEHKGRIVELRIEKSTYKLVGRRVIIDTEYHLSFPFISRGRIIPEQSAGDILKSYYMDGIEAETISKEGLIDAVKLDDAQGEWLFATKRINDDADVCKVLLRYKMKNGRVISETEKLIKKNYKNSRSAGNFFRVGNKIYRPAQNSTKEVYGESVSINEVLVNNEDEYREKTILTITSNSQKRFNKGLHTFNVYEEVTVVDGFERVWHPILKVARKLYEVKEKK